MNTSLLYLKKLHPYYIKRIREQAVNAIVVFVCMVVALLIMVCAAFGESILVETIARESSSESFEAQVMVAQTILTRAKEWHKTPEEVCLQKWQYSCWNEGIRQSQVKRTRQELLKAQEALSYARSATNLPKATHYHDTSIKPPYWAKSMKRVCQIGDLIFYYEQRG